MDESVESSSSEGADDRFSAAWGKPSEGTQSAPVDVRSDGTVLKVTNKKGYGHDRPQDLSKVIASYGDDDDMCEQEWMLDEEPSIPVWVDDTLRTMKAGEEAVVKLAANISGRDERWVKIHLNTFQPPPSLQEIASREEQLDYIRMLREKGNSWFQKKDYLRARRRYRSAGLISDLADFQQEATTAMLNLSAVALAESNLFECRDLCDRVLKRDPRNIKAMYRRASALASLDLLDEALSDLRTALKATNDIKEKRPLQKLFQTIIQKRKAAKTKQKLNFAGVFEQQQQASDPRKGSNSDHEWDYVPMEPPPKEIEHQAGPRVYFDLAIGDGENQQIRFELFEDTAPHTTHSFKLLCDPSHQYTYCGTKFHRVMKNFMIQGGKIDTYQAENTRDPYLDSHSKAGLLSMASDADAQFFILTKPAPHLDGSHRVFGRVLDPASMSIVHTIEALEVDSKHCPLTDVRIVDCGLLS